jgi:hypothetical protein
MKLGIRFQKMNRRLVLIRVFTEVNLTRNTAGTIIAH